MSPTPPFVFPVNGSLSTREYGVSQRALFAAMAMQSLIVRDEGFDPKGIAVASVEYADALLHILSSEEAQ